MTNLSKWRENTSPVCLDFGSRSKRAVRQNSGGPLFIAFEETWRWSFTLISTVGSPSIQWSTTNDAKKTKSSLQVTSRIQCCQRHVSSWDDQPSQRPQIKTLQINHPRAWGKCIGTVNTTETLTRHPIKTDRHDQQWAWLMTQHLLIFFYQAH